MTAASTPLVSVVTIFLNAGRFLDEAVQSVFDQTCQSWELVLVDDGSTDDGTRIARQYSERFPDRVRYVEHPGHANLGMSASRNAGVAVSRGKYVAFLDADDVYLPTRLERHVDVLQSRPDVAVVRSCVEFWRSWAGPGPGVVDETEYAPCGESAGIIRPPALLLLLLATRGATPGATSSVTIRRDVFDAVGGCEVSFRNMYEDQVLLSKIQMEHAVYVMPDVLTRYRQHPDSSVAQAGEKHILATRRHYLDWLEGYVAARRMPDPRVQSAVARALFEYRHPWLWALGRSPKLAEVLLRRCAYALVAGWLPESVIERGRRRKTLRTRRLLDEARRSVGSTPQAD
jgi:glycosyltransferase involved in cell wall biosynthesis